MNTTYQDQSGVTERLIPDSESEELRARDLMRLVPKNRSSVLDIGARDGRFSRLLPQYFKRVVALDLVRPPFSIPGVENVAGNVTKLPFPDAEFDCVFCTEVLEHVPDLTSAASEITRVARCEALIGVPYRQDTRIDRTTCQACGKVNPPWGHINSFDEFKLRRLFGNMHVVKQSFVGETRQRTNPLAAKLMDLAGNPWGSYDQEEHCIHCNAKLERPSASRSLSSKVLSKTGSILMRAQTAVTRAHGNWIHILFSKDNV